MLLQGSHTNIYVESFFGAMHVSAFCKIRLLYCFNFTHCFTETEALQHWLVPRSITLGDVQQQTGLTLCSPAGTAVHFHKLD